MWFNSHRLGNLKGDVYGTKMTLSKWVTMYFENTEKGDVYGTKMTLSKWVTMYFENTESVCLKNVCSLEISTQY